MGNTHSKLVSYAEALDYDIQGVPASWACAKNTEEVKQWIINNCPYMQGYDGLVEKLAEIEMKRKVERTLANLKLAAEPPCESGEGETT